MHRNFEKEKKRLFETMKCLGGVKNQGRNRAINKIKGNNVESIGYSILSTTMLAVKFINIKILHEPPTMAG